MKGRKGDWLSLLSYGTIAKAFAPLNIAKVRFTGGEPLLRPDFSEIVGVFSKHMPSTKLAVTTNGHHLGQKLLSLKSSGLSSITAHIDSLDGEKYKKLMGKYELCELLDSIDVANQEMMEVKINMVVQKGVNDDELIDFLKYSIKTGVQVRFIELMNTGSAKQYTNRVFMSKADILDKLTLAGAVEKIGRAKAEDPAVLYKFKPMDVIFGVIASETEKFYFDCNRLRLSAEGSISGCLYQGDKMSLSKALQKGAGEYEIRNMLSEAINAKRSFHPTIAATSGFSMSQIGG